jgi:hypothetical protein
MGPQRHVPTQHSEQPHRTPGIMKVQTPPLGPRPRFRRLVLALAAIAHLAAIVVAPIVEASAERVSEPHVEESGTSKHHSHTETTCIVCAGHPLVAHTAPEAFRLTVASMRALPPATLAGPPPNRPAGAPVGSRAPPTIA